MTNFTCIVVSWEKRPFPSQTDKTKLIKCYFSYKFLHYYGLSDFEEIPGSDLIKLVPQCVPLICEKSNLKLFHENLTENRARTGDRFECPPMCQRDVWSELQEKENENLTLIPMGK